MEKHLSVYPRMPNDPLHDHFEGFRLEYPVLLHIALWESLDMQADIKLKTIAGDVRLGIHSALT